MKNLLTKEAFAEWCEKQPKHKRYDYDCIGECALTQYAASLGMKTPYGPPDSPIHTSHFWQAANNAACFGSQTFGALAARLRSAS